jgi:hypothetical protein
MMGWLTATVELPRWVVWGALLTQPAIWSAKFQSVLEERLPGGSQPGGSQPEPERTAD